MGRKKFYLVVGDKSVGMTEGKVLALDVKRLFKGGTITRFETRAQLLASSDLGNARAIAVPSWYEYKNGVCSCLNVSEVGYFSLFQYGASDIQILKASELYLLGGDSTLQCIEESNCSISERLNLLMSCDVQFIRHFQTREEAVAHSEYLNAIRDELEQEPIINRALVTEGGAIGSINGAVIPNCLAYDRKTAMLLSQLLGFNEQSEIAGSLIEAQLLFQLKLIQFIATSGLCKVGALHVYFVDKSGIKTFIWDTLISEQEMLNQLDNATFDLATLRGGIFCEPLQMNKLLKLEIGRNTTNGYYRYGVLSYILMLERDEVLTACELERATGMTGNPIVVEVEPLPIFISV